MTLGGPLPDRTLEGETLLAGLRRRWKGLGLLWLALMSVILLRLWTLTVFYGEEYRRQAENNRTRVVTLKPPRGILYDRNGTPLVSNLPSFDISIVPEDVGQEKDVVARLASILGLDPDDVEERIADLKLRRPYEPVKIKENADWRDVTRIEARRIDLPGVVVEVENRRRYLYDVLGAHLVGYIGKVTPEQLKEELYKGFPREIQVGQYGIERSFDKFLVGQPGEKLIEVNAAGREIRLLGRREPTPGDDLQLTLDLAVQRAAEESLGDRPGAVVALDLPSGEVLAMVSRPAFNPNDFSAGISRSRWSRLRDHGGFPMTNRAIQNAFPPGSTFKIAMAAAGLESGVITPETAVTCTGAIRFGNRDFRCWKAGGHGRVSLHRAIVESCDVYFYELGRKLGVDRIAETAKALSLGMQTGIPLPSERGGLIPTAEWKERARGQPWYPGETLSVAIGQGYVLTTPIQLATMSSAVGNGGEWRRPSVVRAVRPHADWTFRSLEESERVASEIKPETLAFIREGLRGVVHEPGGTGHAARVEGLDIGGKTGTAQVVSLRERREAREARFRDHAWFVAVAPVANPRIAVAVFVEHGGHGGSAAAPVARKVIEAYLARKNDPPAPGGAS